MEEFPNTLLSTSIALRSFQSMGVPSSLDLVPNVASTNIEQLLSGGNKIPVAIS